MPLNSSFNPQVKLKLEPTGIAKKYCKTQQYENIRGDVTPLKTFMTLSADPSPKQYALVVAIH